MPDRRSPDPSKQLSMALSVRLDADQRMLLERIAAAHDLTLSGAVRHVLDQELDHVYKRGAPTLRDLLHEDDPATFEVDGQLYELTAIES